MAVKGDPMADLTEDLAAEQKARVTYDNILRLSDDPDVNNVIKFLREREIVHFQRFGEAVQLLREKLDTLGKGAVDKVDNEFRLLCSRLEGVSPLAVLSHGYAMVEGEGGRIISSVSDTHGGEMVEIDLSDGKICATVTEIREKTEKEDR